LVVKGQSTKPYKQKKTAFLWTLINLML